MILGPRAWVDHLMRRHDREDLDLPVTSSSFAREVLDRHQLQEVKVEVTDTGDHYDQQSKAVRIYRGRFNRKTLTAMTTAAHEVAHALQDASDYGPFVWRKHINKAAQITGQVGSIIVVAVPLFTLTSHQPFPLHTVGTAIIAVLGTSMMAQLAALPSEIDASFGRALPILRNGYIKGDQVRDARRILFACSLTYVASSMVSALHFWPWYAQRGAASPAKHSGLAPYKSQYRAPNSSGTQPAKHIHTLNKTPYQSRQPGNPVLTQLARAILKPVIRRCFQVRDLMHNLR